MINDRSLIRLIAGLLFSLALTGRTAARDQGLPMNLTFPDGTTCRVLIVGGDGAAALADITKVYDALSKALNASQDMNDKVKEACAKWNGQIQLNVFRDDPEVDIAGVPVGTGNMLLDLGDMEKLADAINRDEPKVKDLYRDINLPGTLAHEFEHLKDGPGESNHTDPPPECMNTQTGPAVDDENMVMQQMGSLIVRLNYSDTKDGFVAYRIGGVRFYLDMLAHQAATTPVPPQPQGPPVAPPAPPTQRFFSLDGIPEAPCTGASTGCYPRPSLPTLGGRCGTSFTFNPKVLGTIGGALVGAAVLTTGGDGPTTTAIQPPTTPAVTTPPSTPPTAAPPTTAPPTTPPVTTPPVTANGSYRCMLCSIRSDGSNHNPTLRACDGLTSTFTVVEGSLTIRHPAPFIEVSGPNYDRTTGAFDLTGTGSIAGFNNVSARAVGTVNNETGRITFDYTLGANGVFPGGQPITYTVTLQKQ